MSLLRMRLTNYRCFEERTEIELRPLTIVLGKNNSGKSALVRAPLIFEKGIRTNSPEPLDLDDIGDETVESFTDMIYGRRPHGSLSVGMDLQRRNRLPVSLDAVIQHIDEYSLQIVSYLIINKQDSSSHFEWDQISSQPPRDFLYFVEVEGELIPGPLPSPFQGILPSDAMTNGKGRAFLRYSKRDIIEGYPFIRYFGPFRDRPVRHFRSPSRMPDSLGPSGENAGKILVTDYIRYGGGLLQAVNEVLSNDIPGWSLDLVEEGGGMYAIVLRSKSDKTIDVNLADTGTGVAQVLPIFVQRAQDILDPPDKPVLEIVEQPELHLHPAAHGGLADLYLGAIQRGDVRFLIETHSETMLLRLRRRIAEGKAEPESVAIYFVEHQDGRATARRINVDENGNLDYWPEGVFTEDYEEARALASAQLDREDDHAR